MPTPVKVDKEIVRKYEALMESLRTSESRDPAANRFPWQCEAALKQLADFATARQKETVANQSATPVVIRIRTDSFPARIYGNDVADRLQLFVENGGELQVLLTVGECEYDLPSLQRLVNRGNAKVKQEPCPPSADFKNHFCVVSEQAYRFEAPHEPFTGVEFRSNDDFHPAIPARICFNDVRGAQTLTQLFDGLWRSALDLPLLIKGDQRERGTGNLVRQKALAP